jgi:hypothetical protein
MMTGKIFNDELTLRKLLEFNGDAERLGGAQPLRDFIALKALKNGRFLIRTSDAHLFSISAPARRTTDMGRSLKC